MVQPGGKSSNTLNQQWASILGMEARCSLYACVRALRGALGTKGPSLCLPYGRQYRSPPLVVPSSATSIKA